METSAKADKLALELFKLRYVPSACTSHWLQNPTHAAKTESPYKQAVPSMGIEVDGKDWDTVCKQGWWSSDTFLIYITNKLPHSPPAFPNR